MDEVRADDVVPVVLAALVKNVVDALVEEHRRDVVDRLHLRHLARLRICGHLR